MKKFSKYLIICMLLPALLAPVSGVSAQSETVTAVVIGDGAPIPYLDGFQSRLVKSAASIAGVTGAFADVEMSVESDLQSRRGTWRYELQNLVLTDDVLGLFFKQTYSEPIPYSGNYPFAFNLETRMPAILADGEPLRTLSQFSEGRPIDACSQYSFALCSLPRPIADGQTLTIGAVWNIDRQVWEGGVSVTVDRSRADDPTVAYTPSLAVKRKMALWKGNAPVNYDFTIERVAYTPFGNRMLIRFRGTCEFNQYLDYQLLDENGAMLTIVHPTSLAWINASAEHPVWTENEAWFFGGEGSKSLTLVPLGGDWRESRDAQRTASVPLDSLPADVPLENGAVLHAESCDISESGFYIRYATDGYAGYVSFDLGDADGNPLELAFGFYLLDDHSRGLLGYGGIWSEEYNGKTVPRVTREQRSQIETLLIEYTVGCPKLMENEKIEVPLSD